ncbi:hypothetical protein [Kutzneria buriramensis]|uniref:Uncharacterized protein n=1 Tax=Kutzneria buriramensis TaxID=1045776 RepID=A0A3E0HDA4_9PSEU|nr:hypothetical protein [Kutzneria buriramensis]REH42830.1 hypothetical protein BCF44_110331 [Kutzneria buriramensis]
MGQDLLKLLLTPTLIVAATLLQRRWATLFGGRLVGLPLTAASSLTLLTLREGDTFAVQTAIATLSGQLAIAAFCLGYVRTALTQRWPIALAVAVCCYGIAALTLSLHQFSLPALEFLVPTGLAATLSAWPALTPREVLPMPSELSARIAVATVMTTLVLAAATLVGSRAIGLLASFPLFAALFAAQRQHTVGGPAAIISLRAVVTGAFTSSVFFLTIASLLPRLGALAAFPLAAAATVFTHIVLNTFIHGSKPVDSCIGRMNEPQLASTA